jgi:hypothetical protein
MKLELLKGNYQLIKLDPDCAELPHKVVEQDFFSISRTPDELSVIVLEDVAVDITDKKTEKSWQIIKFVDDRPLDSVGIYAKITAILAENDISTFTLSTYNTEYILIKKEKMIKAVNSLKASGYEFI